MRIFWSSLLITPLIFLLFFSCQKEIHFDFVSTGTLDRNNTGDCMQPLINGVFEPGQALSSQDYVEVHVHVTAIGSYTISSDTVNGYSFQAIGNFKDTGSKIVRLSAHGKPLKDGIDQISLVYGASHCSFSVMVIKGDSQALFTLQGSPNSCMIDTIFGQYVKTVATDSSNKIKIEVNVSRAGPYSIASGTVNGYVFSSSGIFTVTGTQAIYLYASGTPVTGGTDVFSLTAGASSCNFSITALATVPITNTDHFPLTKSSYWDYTDLHYQGNIVTTIILDTLVKNGKTYRAMEKDISPGGPLILNFRKTSGNYFEFAAVDKYTAAFQFNQRIVDDIPFLKESLGKGETWQSQEFSNMASNGQVSYLMYSYTCTDVVPSLVYNGHVFNDVYEVEMKPQIRVGFGNYQETSEVYTNYYAKGIGLIYSKETQASITLSELQIKDWQVN